MSSSICLSVNGCTVVRCNVMTPIGIPSRINGTPKQLVLACLLGLEQPRVLDGDYGLISEGRELVPANRTIA